VAVIARDHGLLFIMVPHTGSSAVGRALIEQCGATWLPETPERDANGEIILPRKHNTVPQLISHGVITREERARLVTAGTTRNPFDWLVSQYLRLLPIRAGDRSGLVTMHGHSQGDPRYEGSSEDFEAWVEGRYRRRRRGVLGQILPPVSRKHIDWLQDVDVLLRFERLQETFDALLRRVGITDPVIIPVVNETVSRHERDYHHWYTPRAREMAETAFAGYLERHEYRFEV
jgi:hypothetical protein